MLLVIVLLGLLPVRAPVVDNDGPQRSKEIPQQIQFALVQSVSAQSSAPANQIPTCEQLISQLESDPRTQQASPAERQFTRAFLQGFVQGILDEGTPGAASRLDPDGNGVACEQLLSGGGVGGSSPSASAASASPNASPSASPLPSPSPSPASISQQSASPNADLFEAGGPGRGPVSLMTNGSCPRGFPTVRDGACYLSVWAPSIPRVWASRLFSQRCQHERYCGYG